MIRINKRHKLEKAVVKRTELYRDHLKLPYFINGYVYATNSYIIAKVKPENVQPNALQEGHILLEELKRSRKPLESSEIDLYRYASIHKFPNVDRILNYDDEPTYTIALNARLLYDLSQALGDNAVTLKFRKPTGPIEVVGKYASGAIMPMRL